jgi:hypothetical protein
MVKIIKTIEMGFGVFIMIPMWGVNSPWPQQWGHSLQKKKGKTR